MRVHRIAALAVATLVAAGARAAAPSREAEIEQAVAATRTYDYGQSTKPLRAVEKLVRDTHGALQLRAQLERELVRLLGSDATLASKQFACRQLWIIGTEASVPALARMLLDDTMAESACYALANLPPPAADRALRDALSKTQGNALIAIIHLLGSRRDKHATEALIRLTGSPDTAVAAAATAALGQIATDEAAEALARLRKSGSARLRGAALHASLNCAQELAARGKEAAARATYEAVAASSPPRHIHRGALLGRIDVAGPEAASLVLSALRGDDEALKAAAIARVSTLPGQEIGRLFAQQLAALPPREQALLIGALMDRGEPTARAAITQAASHSDRAVRIAALKALGVVGDASSVPVLVKALGGHSSAEAQVAAISLRMLNSEGVDASIVRSVQAAKGELRAELIRALADRRGTATVPALLAEAASADGRVAKAAFTALGRLAEPGRLPDLIQLLVGLKADHARAAAERAVAVVARQIADETTRADAVLAALGSTQGRRARCSLLHVLGRVANDRACEALVTAVAADNAAVRDAAVRALADWPDTRALGALLKILKGNGDDTCRVLALRGCVRLLKQLADRPAEAAAGYAQVMARARGAEEKKLVLSGLATVHHPEALTIAAEALADERVRTEAALAAVAIARHPGCPYGEAVDAAMRRAAAMVQDAALRNQALSLVRQPPPPLPDVYLDALTPIRAVSGNQGGKGKPQLNRNCIGAPLRLKGVVYRRGVGEHATADLTYALKPAYRRFVCVVGLDDQVARHGDIRGSIVVKVLIDDRLAAQTPALRGGGAAWNLDVTIPQGAKALRLVVEDAGDGVDYDDADFVNAGFSTGDRSR